MSSCRSVYNHRREGAWVHDCNTLYLSVNNSIELGESAGHCAKYCTETRVIRQTVMQLSYNICMGVTVDHVNSDCFCISFLCSNTSEGHHKQGVWDYRRC